VLAPAARGRSGGTVPVASLDTRMQGTAGSLPYYHRSGVGSGALLATERVSDDKPHMF
jgi:hypothetical protein